MAAANAAQKEMQTLYESFWQGSTRNQALTGSLEQLALGFEKTLVVGVYRLYLAATADMTQEQAVQAFSRAASNLKYWPPPATLRELAGLLPSTDPVADEAKAMLLVILAAMRGDHGKTLRPALGRIIYGTLDDPRDKDDMRVGIPIREKSIPLVLTARTEKALLGIGWGSRMAGIDLIAGHPSLTRKDRSDDPQFQKNDLKGADDILNRWATAYREAA